MATTMLIVFYVEFPNTNIVRNVPRLPTRQLTTVEGNLSRPIRIGHNQHTHTSNTRQPKLNSRVLRVHPPFRAQLEGCHSELNSRNVTCLTPTREGIPKSPGGGHVPLSVATSRSPGRGHVPPSALIFTTTATIAWQDFLCRQAPRALVFTKLHRQLTTVEGNLSRPIRIGHNQHTHTSNTRQPKLNSRVLRVHPPFRAQLEGCHSELNSRNVTCLTPTREGIPKSPGGGHVPPSVATSRSPGRGHVPPSALIFTTTATIAWQDFLCRQAPRALVFTKLQTPPGAPLLTARRHRDLEPPVSTLSLGGSITTAVSLRNPEMQLKWYESPSENSSPTRRFLEKF
ncbi:hypothetical protein DEO72_LG5g1845 [Vigna unguiculata]|uniref:Uncharacterized protein n=1 Tax=Vigna unguiculata TaxID=3917 RepID=A0A4D6LXM9_VIGUN|nr:hypothetical protein DEO72_LG5g1845 [Vigna unguiculata]